MKNHRIPIHSFFFSSLIAFLLSFVTAHAAAISGELKQWHKVVLDFTGPNLSEASSTYLNYKIDVTFIHTATGTRRIIPGFYAADGNAGESSATSGSVWRANFMPDQTGDWNYSVSFRSGTDVAVLAGTSVGASGGFMDGETGSFNVAASDKVGMDFRSAAKGKLIYSGKSYPEWMGNGDTYIKAACNSPEVFLEYNDFDGTPTTNNPYTAHLSDWQAGDPVWKSSKGKGIIGVVNYISNIGMNSHYFLTMNIEGDGKQAFPYVNNSQASRFVFDVSKLAQWGTVFEHMMAKGVQVEFVLTECENQSWFEFLDQSDFGISRKLYYREMVARFGHLNAITWNVGEENGWNRGKNFSVANTQAQRIAYAEYLQSLLSYSDNIVVHNGPSDTDAIFTSLVGKQAYRGVSFQGNYGNTAHGHGRIMKWRNDSKAAGRAWIVNYDEPFLSGEANLDTWRKNSCWAAMTAGAAGVGFYSGGGKGGNDLNIIDYRTKANNWLAAVRAKDFFANHVHHITAMDPADALVSSGNWCLANPGSGYVVYLPNGGTTTLDLTGQTGSYTIKWYDPRNGGNLVDGTVTSITGGAMSSLGSAPNNTSSDWAILVTNSGVANTTPKINNDTSRTGE